MFEHRKWIMVSRSACCMMFGHYCLLPAVAKVAIVDEEVVSSTLYEKRKGRKVLTVIYRGVCGCPGVQVLEPCQDIQVSGEETHE